jgi:hypothetical protein
MQPITYSNTYGDIILLQLITALRSKWTYILFAVLAVVILPGNISAVPDDVSMLGGIVTVAVLQVIALTIAGVVGLAFLVVASIMTVGRKGLLEHIVTIDSETVTEQTSQDATVSRWSGIHRVMRTQNHVFIYLTPITAHAIPRRAVTADWDDFYENLLGYWRSARA